MDNTRKIDKLKTLQVRIDESMNLLNRLKRFDVSPNDGYVVEIPVDASYKYKHRISTPLLINVITEQNKLDKAEYQKIVSYLYNQTGGN